MLRKKAFFLLIATILFVLTSVGASFAGNPSEYLSNRSVMPRVLPKKVGLSAERLDRIEGLIQDEVDANRLAGAVALVARKGKIAYTASVGKMDIESGRQMQEDAIFRIMSMSKTITAVATMMLYEEGKFLMQDPLDRYIAEYGTVQVAEPAENQRGFITRDPAKTLTLRDLLTHRAGMPYMDEGGFLSEFYVANNAGLFQAYGYDESLEDYVARLASLPLVDDPGGAWQYGFGPDVMGRVIEIISGQSLDQFYRERIFEPLGMKDSAFYLDETEAERLPSVYFAGNDGQLLADPIETPADSPFVFGPKKLFSGGGGVLSTAEDFARFCQMLLNGGVLGDTRLLSRKSVELMIGNQIENEEVTDFFRFWGDKHGLGVAQRTKRGQYDELESLGTFGFAGVFYTRFWVDPQEDLVVIWLAQMLPLDYTGVSERIKNVAYGAILD